jgi:hypothetical protein
MTDALQLAILGAVLIAFVFVGCLATRAPKKTPNPASDATRPAGRKSD